jgi:hypothetical protein
MSRRALCLVGTIFIARTAVAQAPSRGGTPPGTTGGPAAESTAPAAQSDQAAKNLAEVTKFVRDQEKKPAWQEKEGDHRRCRVDRTAKAVDLTFRADGTMHCLLSGLAEGYQAHVWIYTMVKYAADAENNKSSSYLVMATAGTPFGSGVSIHGAADDAKRALAFLESLNAKASNQEDPAWSDEGAFGPFHATDATFEIKLPQAGLSKTTKVTIERIYSVSLAVLALGGPGIAEYTIANGTIQEQKPQVNLDYYLGLGVSPFAWNKNGLDQTVPGRYYDSLYDGSWDRVLLLVGVSISHPTEKLFVGAGVEVIDGLAFVGGWQPRQRQRLSSGYAVGQAVEGTDVPADKKWDTSGWAVGLSVDASVAKSIAAAFK